MFLRAALTRHVLNARRRAAGTAYLIYKGVDAGAVLQSLFS